MVRRFELHHDEDESGISGTGVVAEGVEFQDGTCVMKWLTPTSSTAVYKNSQELVEIHGHKGKTRLVWVEVPEPLSVIRAMDAAGWKLGEIDAAFEAKLQWGLDQEPPAKKPRCRYPVPCGGGHVEYCGNLLPCSEHYR